MPLNFRQTLNIIFKQKRAVNSLLISRCHDFKSSYQNPLISSLQCQRAPMFKRRKKLNRGNNVTRPSFSKNGPINFQIPKFPRRNKHCHLEYFTTI